MSRNAWEVIQRILSSSEWKAYHLSQFTDQTQILLAFSCSKGPFQYCRPLEVAKIFINFDTGTFVCMYLKNTNELFMTQLIEHLAVVKGWIHYLPDKYLSSG